MSKFTNILKILAIVVIAFSAELAAADLSSSYSFKKLNLELCEAATLSKSAKLRSELTKARVNLRNIYQSIDCDGRSLHEVAQLYQSAQVVKYIEAKVKPSSLLMQTQTNKKLASH